MSAHATMAEKFACYERRKPDGWTSRVASHDAMAEARAFMLRGFTDDQVRAWPQGMTEVLIEWKLATDLLEAAHHHASSGGGMELEDIVREMLRREDRLDKIAEMHRKSVGEGGLTSGDCTECGWSWPCPTYDWARGDSDRGPIDCWDRNDDSDDLDPVSS